MKTIDGDTSLELHAVIFRKDGCHKCTLTEKQFDKLNLPYTEVDVEKDDTFSDPNCKETYNPRDYVVAHYGTALPAVEIWNTDSRTGESDLVISWNDIDLAKIQHLRTLCAERAEQ